MGLTGPGQGEECKGWLQGAANGHLQLTSFPCPEQPHTVPTPACPQPGVGTGTLLLCQSVMRFLLGCLDRKSQLEDAKSLSKAQQSPAQSIQRYPVGEHQHRLHPGAPTAQLGMGHPWDVQSRGFSACLSHCPLFQPMLGTGAASPCPGWGCQVHPWTPQSACQHRAHSPVILAASVCIPVLPDASSLW